MTVNKEKMTMKLAQIFRRPGRRIALVGCLAALAAMLAAVPAQAELAFAPNGVSVTTTTDQAGAYPDLTTNIELATNASGSTEGVMRETVVDLPVGLAGYATGTPACTSQNLNEGAELETKCPSSTQVGTANVQFDFEGIPFDFFEPVYNIEPSAGVPAEFGFKIIGNIIRLVNTVRPGDYGVETKVVNAAGQLDISATTVTLWGVPADSSHDAMRGASCYTVFASSCTPEGGGKPADTGLTPLLRNPTQCTEAPVTATVKVNSYQQPEHYITATSALGPFTGCDALQFNPSLSVQPAQSTADTPSGYTIVLRTPQNPSPVADATSDLRTAVVTLPAGVALSPSAADGLGACTDAQMGLGNANAPECPDASKIGTATLKTPALPEPMSGAIYLAGLESGPITAPPYRMFLALSGDGVRIKLVGTVTPNPKTGQLTTTFENNPQQPFTELTMSFKDGARAPLTTPAGCGTFAASSELVSWSGITASVPSEPFTISGCGNPDTFAPSFTAGTTNPQAGAYSPFTLTLSRSDADQTFSSLTATLPPGLLGKLAGIPLCPEANASAGTCPADSQVGTVEAAAGPGSHPFWLPGSAYLTGPYNGGPYGLAVEVPAIAGPFDLGTVVVRNSIRINPTTAQVSVVSDPFPTIIGGIPIQLRTVNVTMSRPEFTFNPTSCEPMAVDGTLTSTGGMSANLSSRFQAGGCAALAFKPKFKVLVHAHHTRKSGAYMHVVVESGAGQANIHKVDVELPKAVSVRDETLKQSCPEAQYAADPAGCPAGSFVGTATATTPILANALTGPAIFVSHAGKEFPNLDIVLQGEGITIQLTGNTYVTKKGYTFSRFESVPDAPIDRFSLILPEGPHSALAGNGNLCYSSVVTSKKVAVRRRGHLVHRVEKIRTRRRRKLTMPTTITGQSGAMRQQQTKVIVEGCGGTAKQSRAAHKHHHAHSTHHHRRHGRK